MLTRLYSLEDLTPSPGSPPTTTATAAPSPPVPPSSVCPEEGEGLLWCPVGKVARVRYFEKQKGK